AVLITFLFFSAVIWFLGPKFEIIIPGLGLSSYFFNNLFIILTLQLLAGVGLGIAASWLAVRKYLQI
ncbi:MAG: hypothetical protein ABH896_01595, partial [Candidatus Jacksonbacteria bacterium]